ncbi:MAG: hypothetical protein U5R31_16605 [Acidimicrobiia bacterium]|nr:hypothetical protein [Acidimicrobiia bacterium]
MLLAMSQGNDGSMCSIHADSSKGVFGRLAMYAAMTRERLTPSVTNLLVANAVDLIVHLGWIGGTRRVTSVREITSVADSGQVASNELWSPAPDGRSRARTSRHRPPRLDRQPSMHGFCPSWLRRSTGVATMTALVLAALGSHAGLGAAVTLAGATGRPVLHATGGRSLRAGVDSVGVARLAWAAAVALAVLAITGWIAGAVLAALATGLRPRLLGGKAAATGIGRAHRSHRVVDRDGARLHRRRVRPRGSHHRHRDGRAAPIRCRGTPLVRAASTHQPSTTRSPRVR